ncbi:MAG: CRISPR-associated endonuclease Cas2 [Candidatus Doudnabacteria bacterium]|nr:CRISPR-associated endonuclease Cas2 [Candidatus Doudnabacteria bacterium]
MPKKENTIINLILEFLSEASELLPLPFEDPYSWVRRQRSYTKKRYYSSLFDLKERGLITVGKKKNKKFIKLTKKGQLEALLLKSQVMVSKEWDGKWRVIIFDIPEGSKEKRAMFRRMLKKMGYKKLQASVYISPYPLNREALVYLNKTGLSEFIRIMRVDDLGYDKDLKKKFGLK